MNKCREEFEKWEKSIGGAGYDYEVWQAAWNARQPEVVSSRKVAEVILRIVGKFIVNQPSNLKDDIVWDIVWEVDGKGLSLALCEAVADLQLPATAAIPIPTVEELAEAIYQDNTALLTNVEARYIAKVVHKLLTPKGVKHG